jgi:hypothetical protein
MGCSDRRNQVSEDRPGIPSGTAWIPERQYPIRRNSSGLLRALQAVIAIYDA